MMSKTLILFVVFILLNTCSSFADETANLNQIYRMVKELMELNDKGMQINEKFDIGDLSELKRCATEYRKYRDQAMRLAEESKTISELHYRSRLNKASYDTFSCVYCDGDGEECLSSQALCEEVLRLLAKDGFTAKE